MKLKQKKPNLSKELERKEELIDALIVLQSYATQEKENLISELNILEEDLLLSTFKNKFLLEFIFSNEYKINDIYEFINQIKVDPNVSLIKKEILESIKDLEEHKEEEE